MCVYWFLEREEGRERERNINWLPPVCAQTRDWTHNAGTCPDKESDPQPFCAVQDDTPTNWATWPGREFLFSYVFHCPMETIALYFSCFDPWNFFNYSSLHICRLRPPCGWLSSCLLQLGCRVGWLTARRLLSPNCDPIIYHLVYLRQLMSVPMVPYLWNGRNKRHASCMVVNIIVIM